MNVDVPKNVSSLDVSADFILPGGGQFTGGRTATGALAVISWNAAVLFARGKSADGIMVQPSLRIPSGWKYATALPVARVNGDTIEFEPASLTTVVDSPVQIGLNQTVVRLRDADGRAHEVDFVSDTFSTGQPPASFAEIGNALVTQAGLLFGGRHYRHYNWLITVSDGVAHFGLEHHESSDNRLPADVLDSARGHRRLAGLISHEYVHSWNGKYRRPAGLLSPDFSTPMQGELLWVYEGLTTYLGNVLAARSGGWSAESYRERIAQMAADLESQAGRTWRPLGDTAVEAQILYGAGSPWWSLRRGVDFYDESNFIWLEADAIIRERSAGKRSLDDFVSRFYGGLTAPMVKSYTFDDVVAAMNATEPYDWRTYFTTRLESVEAHAPLGGLARSGWRLVFNDTPNETASEGEEGSEDLNLRSSIGMQIGKGGQVVDVAPATLAAKAGLAPGFTILAVNGRKYSLAAMRNALKAGKPLEVIAQNGEYFGVYRIEYTGGLRYPHLVRDESKPDLLSAIIKPR
jgi:predicted metalloprotease with PDZ domain